MTGSAVFLGFEAATGSRRILGTEGCYRSEKLKATLCLSLIIIELIS